MFSVAICDDEDMIHSQFENVISQYSKSTNKQINISSFSDGKSLCDAFESNEQYDLIFLDIEMPERDGIDTGKIIRDMMDNQEIHIVFISWRDNYCKQLFEIRPTNFLQKPISDDCIIKEICTVQKLLDKDNQSFTFKKGHETFRVALKDIIFFESINKTIHLVTTKETFDFYDKIDNVLLKTKSNKFIRIHQSCVVNYSHISKFKYDEVELTNGKILTISQSKRKDIRAMQIVLEGENI